MIKLVFKYAGREVTSNMFQVRYRDNAAAVCNTQSDRLYSLNTGGHHAEFNKGGPLFSCCFAVLLFVLAPEQSAPYQEHTDFLAKNPAPKAVEF